MGFRAIQRACVSKTQAVLSGEFGSVEAVQEVMLRIKKFVIPTVWDLERYKEYTKSLCE